MRHEIDDLMSSASLKLARLKIWTLIADIKARAIIWKQRIEG